MNCMVIVQHTVVWHRIVWPLPAMGATTSVPSIPEHAANSDNNNYQIQQKQDLLDQRELSVKLHIYSIHQEARREGCGCIYVYSSDDGI